MTTILLTTKGFPTFQFNLNCVFHFLLLIFKNRQIFSSCRLLPIAIETPVIILRRWGRGERDDFGCVRIEISRSSPKALCDIFMIWSPLSFAVNEQPLFYRPPLLCTLLARADPTSIALKNCGAPPLPLYRWWKWLVPKRLYSKEERIQILSSNMVHTRLNLSLSLLFSKRSGGGIIQQLLERQTAFKQLGAG